MSEQTMTGNPVCSWVATSDEAGRVRMEARWSVPEVAPAKVA